MRAIWGDRSCFSFLCFRRSFASMTQAKRFGTIRTCTWTTRGWTRCCRWPPTSCYRAPATTTEGRKSKQTGKRRDIRRWPTTWRPTTVAVTNKCWFACTRIAKRHTWNRRTLRWAKKLGTFFFSFSHHHSDLTDRDALLRGLKGVLLLDSTFYLGTQNIWIQTTGYWILVIRVYRYGCYRNWFHSIYYFDGIRLLLFFPRQ